MNNLVFVSYDPKWDDGYVPISCSGHDVEGVCVMGGDELIDWFPVECVEENGEGLWVIESTYYAQFICTSDAHEWDCEFLIDNVREPYDWEYDDIVNHGAPIWPEVWQPPEEDPMKNIDYLL